jgi:DNA-binding NarL/FixJ family response regulator
MNRVLLVEDHESFKESLAIVLNGQPEFEVVGQTGSLKETKSLGDTGADVAVVDLGLPDGDGADVVRHLREVNPELKILILSASVDRGEIARAVEAGAAGVIHKSSPVSEVIDALERLLADEVLLPSEEVVEYLRLAGEQRERRHQEQLAVMRLTKREREVLEALAEGLNSKEIAERLHMTIETERTHVVNLLKKLKVHSRLEAVVFAVRHGVVEIRPLEPYDS